MTFNILARREFPQNRVDQFIAKCPICSLKYSRCQLVVHCYMCISLEQQQQHSYHKRKSGSKNLSEPGTFSERLRFL